MVQLVCKFSGSRTATIGAFSRRKCIGSGVTTSSLPDRPRSSRTNNTKDWDPDPPARHRINLRQKPEQLAGGLMHPSPDNFRLEVELSPKSKVRP